MRTAGNELRSARRLIAACVAGLLIAGAGLLITARDVAGWIDSKDSEIEAGRVSAAVGHLASVWPDLSAEEVATRVAKGFLLKDARLTTTPPRDHEIAVSLAGGNGQQLVWTAPALGREARRAFAPTRMPFILGSVAVVILLLFRLHGLAHALERERVLARGMARRDPLTGLGNRLDFDEEMTRRCDAAAGFVLAYIDLNGFKSVNDLHGHAAGDAVLCGVAARLRRIAGEQDAIFRLGGDEFTMLIADDGRNLTRFARKIVLNVDDAYAIGGGVEAVVGVCVGMALAPQDGRNARDLLHAADAALYRAKATGGSVCRFAAETELPAGGGVVTAAA